MHAASFEAVELPPCQFGPLLNFFGWWSAPKGALMQGPSTVETYALGNATGDGKGSGDSGTDGSGKDSDGEQRVPATAAWCSDLGWWVEQVAAGKTLWPPDLHAAMVAARREGRLGR